MHIDHGEEKRTETVSRTRHKLDVFQPQNPAGSLPGRGASAGKIVVFRNILEQPG